MKFVKIQILSLISMLTVLLLQGCSSTNEYKGLTAEEWHNILEEAHRCVWYTATTLEEAQNCF